MDMLIKAKSDVSSSSEYIFYEGLDSEGGDLVHLEGKTVDELKTFCSNDPSCLGFNTKGWVKTSLLPKFKWNYWTSDPSKGFYLKQGAKFPSGTNSSHSSYMFFQGLDSDGGDLIEKIKF